MKPAGGELRRALVHLRRKEWQKAHDLVMDLDDKAACHMHGLAHRLEGDMENARYWYAKAGVPLSRSLRLAEELKKIESELKTA